MIPARWIFLFFLLILGFPAFSQKISGTITNAANKAPVEYATVSLFDPTGKVIGELITDAKGKFAFKNLSSPDLHTPAASASPGPHPSASPVSAPAAPGPQPGAYLLKAASVGFTPAAKTFSLSSKSVTINIALTPTSDSLATVTVTGTRPLIENHLDKIVYNAANDLTSQSGVALDVLKKVPNVAVDIDGNVELEGDPNIRFLINGKPSTIFGASLTDALQSIPASQIKSIEVIASPGAKYDGSGTGGIINIILKDNRVRGINGAANISAGTRLENGSFNLNAKEDHFGINAFFSGNAQLNTTTINTVNRQSFNSAKDSLTLLQQEGSSAFRRSGYQTGISAEYDITNKDKLTGGFNFDHFGNRTSGLTYQQQNLTDASGNELSAVSSILNAGSALHANTADWSLDYKKDFKRKGQELDFLVTTSIGNNFNDYYQQQNYPGSTGTPPGSGSGSTGTSPPGTSAPGASLPGSGSTGSSPGTDKETDISADYTHPIGQHFTLETGLKTILETLNNTVSTDTLLADGSYGPDANQTYAFTYKRQIYAGYVSGEFTLFHQFLEVQAGARYEYTHTTADFEGVSIPSYGTFFPSFIFSHKLDDNQTIKVAYSYRIERPDYGDLNPFYNISDPHNISTGNPELRPEIGHRYEIGYNRTFGKGNSVYIAALYRYNSDDIQSLATYYPEISINGSTYTDVSLTRRYNIGWQNSWGGNIFGAVAVTPAFSLRSNIQLGSRTNSSPGLGTVTGFAFRGNLNASWKLGKDWMAELFGNYNSTLKTIQGTRPAFGFYTLAVRKELFHRNGSIGFTATNPFNRYVDQQSTLYGSNFNQTSGRKVPYQSFGITLSYKFGKLEFKAKERETNTDPAPIE
jgi:ferric enterobactin receptor